MTTGTPSRLCAALVAPVAAALGWVASLRGAVRRQTRVLQESTSRGLAAGKTGGIG